MRTILLVDDEYGIVEVLRLLLSDEGYNVLTAADGQQALEVLKEQTPDAVITDQMMPLLSGTELFRAMRKLPALRKVPVVLISSAPLLPASTGLPWAMFLQKPFDFEQLKTWLRRHLAATDLGGEEASGGQSGPR